MALRSLGRASTTVLLSGTVVIAHGRLAAAQAPVSLGTIEGKWAGIAGPPNDRVRIALEFKRDSTNDLRAYYTAFAYDALELPGPVTLSNGEFAVASWFAKFKLQGDSLVGSFFVGPFSLGRVRRIDPPPALPKVSSGPGPRWRTALGSSIHAAVAYDDSLVFVGTTGGVFYALKQRDGAFAWNFAAGRPIFGKAAVAKDAVYFGCDNGYLYKLDRATGKERWRYDLGDSRIARVLSHPIGEKAGEFDFDDYGASPLVVGDTVYMGSGDGSVHAINATTGERVWRFEGSGSVRSGLAADSLRVIFATSTGIVYAVDRRSGEQLWKRESRGPVYGAPAIIGDKVVLGNRNGLIAGLRLETGAVDWRVILWGSSAESEAEPTGGSRFFFGSSDLRAVSFIDAANGHVIWRSDVFGWPWARPAVSESRVFVSTAGGQLGEIRHFGAFSALDRTTGKVLWRWPMPEWPGILINGFRASPIVAGNAVFVGGLDGTLYAFPVR